MNGSLTEIIEQEFGEVLQTIGLMWLEPADEDCREENPTDSIVIANISFKGPHAGQVRIAAPLAMCVELSSNMLGLDGDDPAAQTGAEDALKELLNVTCGRLLTAIHGEEPVFDLAPPMVHEPPPDELRQFCDQPDTLEFLADDYPVWIAFSEK